MSLSASVNIIGASCAREVEARRVARACAYRNVPETGSMRST